MAILIEQQIGLGAFTTMFVGGPARFFVRITTKRDLEEVFQFIHEKSLPYFILGSGSNIIFPDEGFDGMVLKMEIGGMTFFDKGSAVEVTVGAGVVWDDFVAEATTRGLHGIANLSLIPGTVGAAPVQNIGAYGVEVKDIISYVEAFDVKTQTYKIFSRDECHFAYRKSIFKTNEGKRYIVTSVTFELPKEGKVAAEYESLLNRLREEGLQNPSVQDIRKTVIAIRTEKLPYDGTLGSVGSFFKNPVVRNEHFERIKKTFPHTPYFPATEGSVKIPAGWIIDNVCNMRGVRKGRVGTYDKQALVIVNYGGASATEVKKFAEEIMCCVKEKTGIIFEREAEYVENGRK
jgi:UDP-N-acetylmuramate dehydrogenase